MHAYMRQKKLILNDDWSWTPINRDSQRNHSCNERLYERFLFFI